MAKTPKYPNPKFFKAKDNIDWKNCKCIKKTRKKGSYCSSRYIPCSSS